MEVIERSPSGLHVWQLFPRLRYAHHQCVRQRAVTKPNQFDGIVQTERVTAGHGNNRPEVFRRCAIGQLQQRSPRSHPEAVALDGVDLTVVRNLAKRLGKPPGGKRVGAVSLVEERDGTDGLRALQVQIEGGEILRQEHAFVNNRPG
jgi:hypothetical protein